MKNEKVEKNPVKMVKLLKENNARVRYLVEQEEEKLMASLPASYRPLVTLTLHTGLRREELLALRWVDVDFRAGGMITVNMSKNGESKHVPLNSITYETLVALKRDRKVLAPYVFTTDKGQRFYWLDKVFKRAVKQAGIDDFRFYDFRHTFASRLTMRGIPLRTIQELMGRKTVAMTIRYAHLSPAHLRDAVEGLCGGVLGGISVPSTVPGLFSDSDKVGFELANYGKYK